LVEKTEDGASIGHSRHYAPIRIDGAFDPGAIVTANIRSVEDGRLIGAAE